MMGGNGTSATPSQGRRARLCGAWGSAASPSHPARLPVSPVPSALAVGNNTVTSLCFPGDFLLRRDPVAVPPAAAPGAGPCPGKGDTSPCHGATSIRDNPVPPPPLPPRKEASPPRLSKFSKGPQTRRFPVHTLGTHRTITRQRLGLIGGRGTRAEQVGATTLPCPTGMSPRVGIPPGSALSTSAADPSSHLSGAGAAIAAVCHFTGCSIGWGGHTELFGAGKR